MSNNTINASELRRLLENAWAAGYIARDAGLSATEATNVRAKYVEDKVAPYVPAPKKIEEVKSDEGRPMTKEEIEEWFGFTQDDFKKTLDDFFFGEIRNKFKEAGREVPPWAHL